MPAYSHRNLCDNALVIGEDFIRYVNVAESVVRWSVVWTSFIKIIYRSAVGYLRCPERYCKMLWPRSGVSLQVNQTKIQ